jgi:DNA repair exonuclease SbcCD ATPase subunit
MVQITGKNDNGKTSVLDSIWWALAGTTNIQKVPIRNGEERALIRLDLGELKVERKFRKTAKGNVTTTVTVRPAEIAGVDPKNIPPLGSPQEILDALLDSLSFDPLAFSLMKSRQQFEELRNISELDVDIDALDAANTADFKGRTDINREAKGKRAQAEGVSIQKDLPAERISEDALVGEIEAAGEHNASIETRKARREQARRDVQDEKAAAERFRQSVKEVREIAAARVAELRQEVDRVEKEAKAVGWRKEEMAVENDEHAAALQAKITSAKRLPEPINVSAIREKLAGARETNDAIGERESRDRFLFEAKALETEAAELTERMKGREKQKVDAIKSAKLPLPDLGFGDGFVTYGGLPFEQASDAQRLRVSTAIAMAKNPKLRVIRIRNGSLLDEDNLAILAEMAREEDFQVWIERVDSSGKVGIVMEDGMVKTVNEEASK